MILRQLPTTAILAAAALFTKSLLLTATASIALLIACNAAPQIDLTPKPDAVRGKEIADMKWGMFICWSMASAINAPSEWVRTPVKPEQFNASGCDTDQWCKTAKEANMGYILFLAKHHDGFCLWDTKTTDLKVTNSPLGIDVIAKLRKSCDKYGIKLALYFSEGDWTMDRKKATDPEQAEFKKAQLKELLTQYGPVEFIWFDHAAGFGGLDHLNTDKWVRQWQPNCFSGFNHGQPAGRISLRERGTPGPIGNATAMGNQMANEKNFAFTVAEFTYPINQKYWFFNIVNPEQPNVPVKKIYEDYLGAVKYGNIFSIDVGPNLEGKLREIDVKALQQVGRWIRGEETLHDTADIRATTPVTQNRDHTYDWQKRHQQVLERNKIIAPEVIMIGDSITHLWGGLPQVGYAPRGADAWKTAFGDRTVTNLGFASDRTENVLWRIANGELDGITPKQVVLLIGINNIGAGDSVEDVTAGIETVCLRIHEKLPNAKILVLGVLPCTTQKWTDAADRVNFQLQTSLHPQSWVDVLDLGNKFRNPDGTVNPSFFSDGLHPNAAGYAIIAEELKPKLAK